MSKRSPIDPRDTFVQDNVVLRKLTDTQVAAKEGAFVLYLKESQLCLLDENGVEFPISIQVMPRTIPASASPGVRGEACYDSSYLYICVGNNSWKRVALSSF